MYAPQSHALPPIAAGHPAIMDHGYERHERGGYDHGPEYGVPFYPHTPANGSTAPSAAFNLPSLSATAPTASPAYMHRSIAPVKAASQYAPRDVDYAHNYSPAGVLPPPAAGEQQPTYNGYIKTSSDAILLLSACDLPDKVSEDGSSPGSRGNSTAPVTQTPPPRRVTRRLLDSERATLIRSGSVFVWDEKEAGMRRWTDGRCWSASRVSGCFLTYRELEVRKRPSCVSTHGAGATSNQYKTEGLIKQSFSITTTSGRKLHVISYFTKRDVREGRLRRVSEDPRFVGEGGGEWGLKVNEVEYPDPISRAGDVPNVPPPLTAAQRARAGSSSPASPVSPPFSGAPIARYHDPAAMPSARPASPHGAHPIMDAHGQMYAPMKPGQPSGEAFYPAFPYAHPAAPLGEAKGLLPIQPMPVQSRSFGESPSHRAFPSPTLPPPAIADHSNIHPSLLASPRSMKRLRDDTQSGESEESGSERKPQRPRLGRVRSSSYSGVPSLVNMRGTYDSSTSNVTSVSSQPRASSEERERKSMGRGKHAESNERANSSSGVPSKSEQDSAVGALLSLRSCASAESASNNSPRSPVSESAAKTNSAINAAAATPAGPTRSSSDRAALDKFSLRL